MIECKAVDIGGRRVVHVGTYTLAFNDGDAPERRLFLTSGWTGSPPLPLGPDALDIPASALPALLDALQAIAEPAAEAFVINPEPAP